MSLSHLLAVGAAALLPWAAGLLLVAWSRVRAARHARDVARVDARLRAAFVALEATPTPQHLLLTVEALAEQTEDAVPPPVLGRAHAAPVQGGASPIA